MLLRVPPRRRAQDAIAEIHLLATHGYEWCWKATSPPASMRSTTAPVGAAASAIGDRRVLALVKAFCKAASSARIGSSGTPAPAPPKAGSCPRCWPTSPCRCWTSTPPRPGGKRPPCSAIGGASGARPPGGWSATRTTLWSWWPAPTPTPRRYAGRWPRAGPDGLHLAAAKTRTCHIDEGFDFLGSASSGTQSEARPSATSTPTPPRRPCRGQGEGASADQRDHEPNACGPVRPAQPGAEGLDHLLPAQCGQGDLQLPVQLCVATGDLLASPQASPRLLEAAPPPLPARLVAGGGQGAPCQPRPGPRHPVSLPRNTDPDTMDEHDAGTGIARRHGLVESRMRGDTHVRFGGAGRGTRPSERATLRPGPTPTRPALRAAASGGRPRPATPTDAV